APAPGRAIGLRDNACNWPSICQHAQRGHGKLWRSHEYDAHAMILAFGSDTIPQWQ
ncbi:MAG: hypothetical protein RL635_621, partial [Chloroflexota bacterium]